MVGIVRRALVSGQNAATSVVVDTLVSTGNSDAIVASVEPLLLGESRIACPKLETSKVGRVDTSIEAKTSVVGELDESVTAVDEEALADRVGRVAGSDTYGGPDDGGSGLDGEAKASVAVRVDLDASGARRSGRSSAGRRRRGQDR